MKHELDDLTQVLNSYVDEISERLMALPLEQKETYACWLAQTYFIVRHSTRFLTLAASNIPIENRNLHYNMIHHLKEELNHDLVAISDLKELGYSPFDFAELTPTSLLYQTQYFWLNYRPVTSLMGYALLLEGLASKYGPAILARVSCHGKRSTAFLKLHCEVDKDHFQDGLKSLESVAPSDWPDIKKNVEQSGRLYLQLIQDIGRGVLFRPKNALENVPAA